MAKDETLSPGWMIFLGVIQILTGILAIALPHIAGMAVSTIIGIVLLVAGGFQIVGAFRRGSFGSNIGGFLGGVLYLLVGILAIAHPLITLGALTLLAGMLLIFRGFLRIGASLEMKPIKGWGWVMFGGIVALLLGIMILFRWPYSAWWFIGTVIGIELLFSDWSLVFLGMAAKDAKDTAEA